MSNSLTNPIATQRWLSPQDIFSLIHCVEGDIFKWGTLE